MKSRNTSAGKTHPRTDALGNIINQFNVWAMAPREADRIDGLKRALNTYSKAIKAGKYPPVDRNFAMRTGYCNEPPPPMTSTGSFASFFGAPEEDTADNNNLPWKD